MKLRTVLILLCISLTAGEDKDYYELLGIGRNADNKEIRKAFKKLAVTLHPDKKKDDPNAHAMFVKLTRAYEVLKDPSLRKHYDMYGDEKTDTNINSGQYYSYTYYKDLFGIYDDDPEIITFNIADFEANVEGSDLQWFVNFYSPLCSHCHALAPAWRQLAKELKGVVMFGAVNCEDDWTLCRKQNIRSYPSLVFYPKGERYEGPKTKERLFRHILDHVNMNVTTVKSAEDWDVLMKDESHRSWVLMLCESQDLPSCPYGDDRTKLAGVLSGLVGVALVHCEELMSCSLLTDGIQSSLVYWQKGLNKDSWSARSIRSSQTKPQDVLKEVLDFLPALVQLDSDSFKNMIKELEEEEVLSIPWLVHFHIGADTDFDLEVKKLSVMLPSIRVGRVNCGRYSDICAQVSVSHYPSFAVFKMGGGYEFYYGQTTIHSIANFAKESSTATNLRTLSQKEFPSLVSGQDGRGSAWFIDFYAPWCPPCMRLLPEFRKASRQFDDSVRFGTVDCTIHSELCRQHNIKSYPTTVLFNLTKPIQRFKGRHAASSISEFLTEFLNPKLQILNAEMFTKLIVEKKEETMWFVSYTTATCPDCFQLNSEMAKLAQLVADFPYLSIGQIDCDVEGNICDENNIKLYPTIILYPYGSTGMTKFIEYSYGFRKDRSTMRRWLFNFLPDYVKELTPQSFEDEVKNKDNNWLVVFYAPFCGHCLVFAPDFTTVAYILEGRVKSGKFDCQRYSDFCILTGIDAFPTVIFYDSQNRGYRGIEITTHSVRGIVEFVENFVSRTEEKKKQHDEL